MLDTPRPGTSSSIISYDESLHDFVPSTYKDLYSSLKGQRKRLEPGLSSTRSRGSSRVASSTSEAERAESTPDPTVAPSTSSSKRSRLSIAELGARVESNLGKEVQAIRMRLDHEQYRRKQSERLNRLWELMRRGASICQSALQYEGLLVALAVHGEEERILRNWVKQIRYILWKMYLPWAEQVSEKEKRLELIQGLTEIETNLVWYGNFMAGWVKAQPRSNNEPGPIGIISSIGQFRNALKLLKVEEESLN